MADTGAVFFRRYILNSYSRKARIVDVEVPLLLPADAEVRASV
jgi:hypothetical protein